MDILDELRQALILGADESVREGQKRYHKEGDAPLAYGLTQGDVNAIVRFSWEKIKHLPKQEVFALCEELWKSAYFEEAILACQFSEKLKKSYEPEDFDLFDRWVKSYLTNWADCDTFCNHTIGEFLMRYPDRIERVKSWIDSPSRLVRRASAVSLILPIRKGFFLDDVFEIADRLLLDKEDLVQKGYGWMLKVASEVDRERVYVYVLEKRDTMPRTALRYAIEKMPAEMKAEAMKRV